MRNMPKLLTVTLILCLISALSFTGCGNNNNPPGQSFTGDNFDSYPTGAWAPPTNGWQSLTNKTWSIEENEGVTGSALWFVLNAKDCMVHAADAQNYTLSVQLKHASGVGGIAPTSTYHASIIGRCENINSYYAASVYTHSGSTLLTISKRWKTGDTNNYTSLISIQWFTGALDIHTYYTLSLQCQGSSLTATASGGGKPTVSTSVIDDGVSHGPVLDGEWVGVSSLAFESFHPYFDDFTVDY